MADKPRFRVPTLEEMEKADRQEEYTTSRALFRREGSSRPVDNAPEAKSDSPPKAKNTPRKRMISQKALLSRMPLSRQTPPGQTKISPSSAGSVSAEKVESATVRKGLNSEGDPLAYHQVSHSITDNVSQSKSKGPPVAMNTGQASVSKSITSSWTGNTLGGDRRHAQQPPRHLPAASVATGPQKETVTNRDGSSALLEQTESASSASAGTTADDADQQQQHAVRADVLPTLAKLGKTNSLVVNSRQRGNPILKFVRNVPWEFGNIVPDYVMGQSNCALYLSLRYHQLHPEYIHTRLKQLGHSFDLRVLLVQVDIKDPHHLLKDLAKICILADCTLMVAFSAEEAGRYLETYKVYENKAAEAIMERTDSDFTIQLSDCLTRVKSVNKTDCSTLLATFGDLKGIMGASTEDLSLCPGFGPQKAKRLHDIFREPFLVSKKQRADTASTKK